MTLNPRSRRNSEISARTAPSSSTTRIPFTSENGKYVNVETLFLPLSEDGIKVSKILVFSHCERCTASWRPS
jgi:hypothetical protein